jgi:hypothetical protein
MGAVGPSQKYRQMERRRLGHQSPHLFLGMKAANEYKSSIATASFLVAGLAFFALVFLQYLGK